MKNKEIDHLIDDCNEARLEWLVGKRERLERELAAIYCELAASRCQVLPSFEGVESGGAAWRLQYGSREEG